QRGELLYGQGDPITPITIDEQAVVFTIAYAKDHGIWPRTVPKPAGDHTGTHSGDGTPSTFPVGGTAGGSGGQMSEGRVGGPAPPDGATNQQTQPSGPPSFTAEGLLKEALIRLWEQARARRVELIGSLTIRLFDAADAFRLLSVVTAI